MIIKYHVMCLDIVNERRTNQLLLIVTLMQQKPLFIFLLLICIRRHIIGQQFKTKTMLSYLSYLLEAEYFRKLRGKCCYEVLSFDIHKFV